MYVKLGEWKVFALKQLFCWFRMSIVAACYNQTSVSEIESTPNKCHIFLSDY